MGRFAISFLTNNGKNTLSRRRCRSVTPVAPRKISMLEIPLPKSTEGTAEGPANGAGTGSGRLPISRIESGMHCSIIGTCVNDDDLVRLMKKSGMRVGSNAQSHEIHGFAVREAGNDGPFSRALTKLLNRRFEGALRLIARAATGDEALATWASLRDSGQIAAGYWAVMSLAAVPVAVKKRVFGEVHMLSHLHGQGASQLASRLAAAERRIVELEGRLQRAEASKAEALAERDTARAEASALVERQRPAVTKPIAEVSDARLAKRLAKCERALVIARARARLAESELEGTSRAGTSRDWGSASTFVARAEQLQQDRSEFAESRGGTAPSRILYLGGRASVLPHLREVARRHAADVVHHDGGVEDNPHRIGDLVSRCDAVVCPIDCVSHGACRMAKAICRRLNKQFVPISTASRSGFDQALARLARGHAIVGDHESGRG